jgi:hypothetical protein
MLDHLAARHVSLLAPLLLALAHCQPLASDSADAGQDTTTSDVAQYNALEQKLAANATVLVPSNAGPALPSAVQSQLFYLEFPVEMPTQPTLHRYDDTAHSTLDYTFGIDTTNPGPTSGTIYRVAHEG